MQRPHKTLRAGFRHYREPCADKVRLQRLLTLAAFSVIISDCLRLGKASSFEIVGDSCRGAVATRYNY